MIGIGRIRKQPSHGLAFEFPSRRFENVGRAPRSPYFISVGVALQRGSVEHCSFIEDTELGILEPNTVHRGASFAGMLRVAFQWSATRYLHQQTSAATKRSLQRPGDLQRWSVCGRRFLRIHKVLHRVSKRAAQHTLFLSNQSTVPRMARAPDAFAVAPMMDVTDLHFRTLCRMISKRAVLYTEMVVDSTLKHNAENADRWLAYGPEQQPLVLQLGGSEPETMRAAALVAAPYNYSAVNLNCGCPSDRVAGRGCFGAALMKDPSRVAALCRAIAESMPSHTPVTVKCRLGVDDLDSYVFVRDFVRTVSNNAPVHHFIVHARKAWLKGLSPAENRTVPPLWYERVSALRDDFPHLNFSINGGIRTLDQVRHFLDLESLYGVMLGRAVVEHPWETLAGVDALIYHDNCTAKQTRRDILQTYGEYVDAMLSSASTSSTGKSVSQATFRRWIPNPSLHLLLKPVMNLFWGVPRSKNWRKMIQSATEEQTRRQRNGIAPAEFSWAAFLIEAAEQTLDPWYLDATWMEEQAQKREMCSNAVSEEGYDQDDRCVSAFSLKEPTISSAFH